MTQCGFKQRFFIKGSIESKRKWVNEQKISYKKYGIVVSFSVLYVNLEKEDN